MMASKHHEARSLMDEFLMNHDFSAAYEISINAPASVVSECLLHLDFNELCLVRLLMSIRSGKWLPRNRKASDLRQRLQGTGFVILADVPNEEIVISVAGRFWRPDGGRCMELAAKDFAEFSRSGFAKATWNFKLWPESPRSTVLSTETRIKCLGQGALWKFRIYWTFVGPFSGLIRKAILKRVKAEAESTLKGAGSLAVSAASGGTGEEDNSISTSGSTSPCIRDFPADRSSMPEARWSALIRRA